MPEPGYGLDGLNRCARRLQRQLDEQRRRGDEPVADTIRNVDKVASAQRRRIANARSNVYGVRRDNPPALPEAAAWVKYLDALNDTVSAGDMRMKDLARALRRPLLNRRARLRRALRRLLKGLR